MDNTTVKGWKKEQNRRRFLQMWYGQKFFSMPYIYKLKNKAYSKEFKMGKGVFIGDNVALMRTHKIISNGKVGAVSIGEKVTFGSNVYIEYSGDVIIGNHVDLSNGVKIYSHKHDCYEIVHSAKNTPSANKVVISDNVWIGANAIILPGVTIGEYSVVGAGSVITHDVPSNSIVAGNPARFIRSNTKDN